MVGINIRRRHDEEALRRRRARQRAERLSDLRSRFVRFMDERGLSDREKELELRTLDRMVEFYEDAAEEGLPDEHPVP